MEVDTNNNSDVLSTKFKPETLVGYLTAGPFTYQLDTQWDPGIHLGNAAQDPIVCEKVLIVARDPYFAKSFGGHVNGVTKALKHDRLIVEPSASTCPFSILAHTIMLDLLNPEKRLKQLPIKLLVGSGDIVLDVYPRTVLCFKLLAEHLQVVEFRSFHGTLTAQDIVITHPGFNIILIAFKVGAPYVDIVAVRVAIPAVIKARALVHRACVAPCAIPIAHVLFCPFSVLLTYGEPAGIDDGQVTKVVGNMVQKLWKDKRKRDTFEDVYTEVKKQATVKKVMEASKVPPGLVDDAFDLI
ncbi:hypothetical protein BGZ97_008696, partial [Linnemannia gamsii]